MGLLGQMYRLLTVAGPEQGAGTDDRRPLQLRINEYRRQLDMNSLPEGSPEAQHAKVMLHEMEKQLAERNTHAQELETQDQQDAAMELYEANVADMFDGSLPYERLLTIYTHQGAKKEAQRIARACLAHAAYQLSPDVRAMCLAVLSEDMRK